MNVWIGPDTPADGGRAGAVRATTSALTEQQPEQFAGDLADVLHRPTRS